MSKAFIGLEAEGPSRGEQTVFIPKSCDSPNLLSLIAASKIKRIYFGAGNDRGVHQSQVELVTTLVKSCTVLLEVDDYTVHSLQLLSVDVQIRVQIIYVVPVPILPVSINHVKFITPQSNLVWFVANSKGHHTLISDELYKTDSICE